MYLWISSETFRKLLIFSILKSVNFSYSTSGKKESLPLSVAQNANEICYFCGNHCHPRSKCPACNKCSKKGHFVMVCKSAKSVNNSTRIMASAMFQTTLASIISGYAGHSGLSKSICTILIHNKQCKCFYR